MRFWTLIAAIGLAGIAIFGWCSSPHAQTSCTQVGNTTYCSGPNGNYSCTRVGNTVYCN